MAEEITKRTKREIALANLAKAGPGNRLRAPTGRPKKTRDPLEYARSLGMRCIEGWQRIADDPKTSNELRNKVLLNIMAYGFGKPGQSIKHTVSPSNEPQKDLKQITLDNEMNAAMTAATDIIKKPSIIDLEWSQEDETPADNVAPDSYPDENKNVHEHVQEIHGGEQSPINDPFAIPVTSDT